MLKKPDYGKIGQIENWPISGFFTGVCMEIVEEKWEQILETLRTEYDIKEMLFNTWLKPLRVGSVTDSTLTLIYPIATSLVTNKDFVVKYITEHYGVQLAMVVSQVSGKDYEILIDVQNKDAAPEREEHPYFTTSSNYAASHLNEKFTFETFVVGSTNRFAQQASLAVADSPGKSYNPLYIYGGPGLGKTHLIHAIGNYILQEDPSKKVLYVTSEEFMNEVIDSIRNNTANAKSMSNFRDKYRMVDVLLIDDIQFIIGKEQTQEEFFHTFNSLTQAGKQIVLTSDKSPKEMKTLEERIRTRFEQGLMADIGYPEYELRMAILRKIIEEDGIDISDEILNYIASNIKSNVRELEGALNKLVAYRRLENTEITMGIAIRELSSFISPDKPREITPQTIIEVVADHYKISIDQMVSSNRSSFIATPRQVAMYLCKTMTDCSLDVIGSFLGGRNHSTIIHGAGKIAEEYEKNPEMKEQIDAIKKKLAPQ